MRYWVRLLGIFLLLLIPFFACMDFGDGESEGCGPYKFDLNGDPCRGVLCPSDGNECTREYCSSGTCQSSPVTDGKPCAYDGLEGVCVAGVCGENLCEGVDCDDEPCSTGRCDYVDGLCDYNASLPNGTPCMYDGLEGICMDGVCGENPCAGVVCDDGDPCTEGRCDYADGTCDFAPVVCDDREECTEDTCDPTDGCVFTAVEDGTECDGPHGMCQAGSCVWWPYTQDFESLDRMSPTALSDDGWSIYGQVLDASGTVKFGYGPFPAPNDTADPSTTFFSAIVTGEGGPEQGAQQLLVFNHYDCCGNEGHFNGTDKVRSSVFQQKSISADQVGKILEFSFDAKRGDINDPTGNSTALAFVQTFDLDAGYAQTNSMTVDTTNVGATWKRYSTSLEIDAGLVGQLLEFGFSSVASNFEPSSVFYDNILVVLETRPD